jgi:DNA polymerase III alpha subunit
MDGVPRHLSIHVGGMLITAAALVDRWMLLKRWG